MFKTRLALLVLIGLVSATFTATLSRAWAADLRAPAVTILGSGSDLSILITAGDSRLVVAVGDNPSAFSEALGSALRPHVSRIDVVLVTGRANQLLVPLAVVSDSRVRSIYAVDTLPPGPIQRELPPSISELDSPVRIDLSPDTVVEVYSRRESLRNDQNQWRTHWRINVLHGGDRLVVVSDSRGLELFPLRNSVNALIVSQGLIDEPGLHSLPPAVIFNARQVEGRDVREIIAQYSGDGRWIVRVHPGQSVRLSMTGNGVEVDPESTQWIRSPSEESGPG